jgi:hypothetical protein
MKFVPLLVLRLVLSLLVVGWFWNVKNGELIRSFHPVNLLMAVSLLTASICIWIPMTRVLACVAAIVFATVFGFQIFSLLLAFPSGSTFSSNLGPLQFEGGTAHAAVWIPLFAIILCGIATLGLELRKAEQAEDPNRDGAPSE